MIRTDRLSLRVGDFQLRRLSLEVARGEYFVLLGPTGSGKTVFLECLCGLNKIDSGKIYIDGCEVTDLEPRARGVGYVPQDYALFPHLSVGQNIGFGLRVRGHRGRGVAAKVTETADLLGIRDLLPRRTEGLSGGEKQRVALARALLVQPKVLLLDEPVCALDEFTRQDVCTQLSRIQRGLNLTTIHVSHNLEEAFSVADRAGVLCAGVLQQVGSMGELLRKPNSEFVARFMRFENIFCGEVMEVGTQNSYTKVKVGDIQLHIPGRHHGKLRFVIRPDDVLVSNLGDHNDKGVNRFHSKIICSRDYGGYVRVELGGPLNVVAHLTHTSFAKLKTEPLSYLIAVLPPENIHVLPE